MPDYTHHIPPPCNEAVEIIFADDDILVAAKPAGLLSVPGRVVKDCLLQRMVPDFREARIVHRLDLDTSGLMVLALSQRATSDLNRQFRDRLVEKEYLAVVAGKVSPDSGSIDLPIARDWARRPRQKIDLADGKPALTRYEVLEHAAATTRLKLKPVTGRSHQLRIHLAHIGHPILGCDLYAPDDIYRSAPRLYLHASSLSFTHPATGDLLVFDSSVPF